jgi:hypothetical protein
MANASLGTVAISMTLWLADWGAGHAQKATEPAEAVHAAAAVKQCNDGVQAPVADSDLEVVVCAHPTAR